MKNIHLIPTDKPSRLWTNNLRRRLELDEFPSQHPSNIAKNIYITSDEEIKEGDWMIRGNEQPTLVTPNFFWDFGVRYYKIILTTDQDLIKNGVQAIDDEFLEWFVKNPSCEEVEVTTEYKDGYGNWFIYDKEFWNKINNEYKPKFGLRYKIIIPKEEPKPMHEQIIEHCGGEEKFKEIAGLKPKQETLEEFALKNSKYLNHQNINNEKYEAFILGAKWQQERMYSEEEVLNFTQIVLSQYKFGNTNIEQLDLLKETLHQFKKK
jgi:hypothetical protein